MVCQLIGVDKVEGVDDTGRASRSVLCAARRGQIYIETRNLRYLGKVFVSLRVSNMANLDCKMTDLHFEDDRLPYNT